MPHLNGKSHNKFRALKKQKLFNQSYKVQIKPLVIYAIKGEHTHTHTQTN